jgi:EAL and modified HD-GYP domain-containing signal transduction protein
VDSIPHALRLLGRDPLYRWLCLMLVSMGKTGGDVRVEIVKATLSRARMCEMLGNTMRGAARRKIPSPGSLFLTGLFAQIDQLVGTPLEDLLRDIHVTSEVRAALLTRGGHAGSILKSAEAYADADWEGAEKEIAGIGGDPDILPSVYLDAVTWAGERVMLNAS